MNGSGSRVYWVKNLKFVENVDWRKSMIKCEVVFDGDVIKIGVYIVDFCSYSEAYHISIEDEFIKWCETQEQAIKYCMEN